MKETTTNHFNEYIVYKFPFTSYTKFKKIVH